jgi:choline kinase
MHATLLVLAAGMGSRYGGLKQIDPVGPSGETVLDYAVFDAMRSGFDRVVFVIRSEFDAVFRSQIGAKYSGRIAVDYVHQSLNDLPAGFTPPAGREKPWGTGHAVWCARDAVRENFAVINADDFYGQDSFRQLAAFLHKASADSSDRSHSQASGKSEFAMVGFRLAKTLSEHGAVSRGICTVDAAGSLRSIVERTGILATEVGSGRAWSGEEIVSMNCWGFQPTFFTGLDEEFREFLSRSATELKSEFYLPAAVSKLIDRGRAEVRLLPTESSWFGVTYRDDKPRVVAALAELVRQGVYPARLF